MRVTLVKQGVEYHFCSKRSPNRLRLVIEHGGCGIDIFNYRMPIKLRRKHDRVLGEAGIWHYGYDSSKEQPFLVTIERMSTIGMFYIFDARDN